MGEARPKTEERLLAEEVRRRQRARATAMGVALGALVILIFLISIVRMTYPA